MPRKLTPTHVLAGAACFFALAGGADAAATLAKNSVGTKQLKAKAVKSSKLAGNAVTSSKVRNDALTGDDVRESSLAKVPSAAQADSAGNAATVGGLSGEQLKLRCPAGTAQAYGGCLQLASTTAKVSAADALQSCSDQGGRLPLFSELNAIRQRAGITWAGGQGANQYEHTGEVDDPATKTFHVLDKNGQWTSGLPAYYRCIITPVNG